MINRQQTRIKKQCGLPRCTLPTIEYAEGEIIIFNAHHGARHVNRIPLDWIIEQAAKDGKAREIIEKLKGEFSNGNEKID